MKLNEMELEKKADVLAEKSTSLTITHVQITQDDRTGMLESRTLRYPVGRPDMHLGAVGGE